MLTFVWITLRFIHFASLMLVYGCALYGAWLAPASIRRLMTRRFLHLQRHAAAWSVISAAFMLAIQGGLMGGGWPDVFSVSVWGAVLQTRFGAVWIWQIILALVTLAVVVIAPVKMQRRLLILTVAQFILLAGVGHATMRDGVVGTLQQINHALHLLCAATWFGGLLPVVYCMRMAQGRWRQHAISAMMRFSRYGHFCGGRIAHRHWQHAIYHGIYRYLADHLWTVAFVKMCAGRAYGSNCADESVCSRTTYATGKSPD